MSLHQRIGRIFHANENTNVRRNFSNSLRRFLIKDIGTDRNELKVVLLVESPHTHEVGYRYPLAGETGRHVRDIINREEIKIRGDNTITRVLPDGPIGRFVRDGHLGRLVCNNNHPEFLRLGIMNVSQLPFQDKAYDSIPWENNDCRGHCGWDDYIKCMEHIKKYPDVKEYRGFEGSGQLQEEITQLRAVIAEDLRTRLDRSSVNNPNVLLVCCGPVAKEFYKKIIDRMPVCAITCDLPHPARNKWKRLSFRNNECLQEILNRIWPPQTGA